MLSVFGIVAVFFSLANASVSDCSSGTSKFTLTSMSFLPDPTVPGKNSTLLLSMNVPSLVESGTVTYSTTYNFIPFTPTVEPLCDSVVCPIQPGTLQTFSSYPISADLSGSLQMKIDWRDNSSTQLLCVLIKTKMGNAGKQLVLRKSRFSF